jgi:thymidylate synthase (FAD)
MEKEVAERLGRASVPEIDAILGEVFPVLDQGHIRVIDYMGNDAAIVQAARVSYGKGTKHISEDEGLIRYLLRHTHTTPFEMCEMKFHIRIPMDAWRQFIRHRTANVNEYSTRYSEAIDARQETQPDGWRAQSGTNKQGSAGLISENWDDHKDAAPKIPSGGGAIYGTKPGEKPGEYLSRMERMHHDDATNLYEERLKFGVAKEVARKDLPLSTYTEAYWKCDLHNILHFLSLRMDKHAQLEIRSYANVMGEIVSKWCPMVWRAWNDYNFRRGALLLSDRDKTVIQLSQPNKYIEELYAAVKSFGWMEKREDGSLKSNREREECEAKLKTLGLPIPW